MQLNEQAMEALTMANGVRIERAKDKRLITVSALDAASILRSIPSHWTSARISELLMALPRVGRSKAQRWCATEGCSLDRRLTELTSRQRERLARHIDDYVLRRDNLRRSMEGR